MGASGADGSRSDRRESTLPIAVSAVGSLLLLIAASEAVFALQAGGSALKVLLDLAFLGAPGAAFAYAGYWLPRSDITPSHYPRIVAWILGGVGVMYGFIVLRDLHPGVTVEWSIGTQAIALTIGSVGGLLIGVQETRATIRTAQLRAQTAELEDRTRELKENERELERRNAQLEKFAGVVSHDLRNPLNVAAGNLDLARQTADSDRLETVADAHSRMEALIEDLLALARQGDGVSDLTSVDLAALSNGCWSHVSTPNATLSVGEIPAFRADPDRLEQLLENLFRNSVEHGSTSSRPKADDSVEHGSTSSRAEPGDSVEHGSTSDQPDVDGANGHAAGVTVTVGTLDGGDGFYVADDGPGIPADARDRVLESGYTTDDSGTGFGLAIVREIAEAHGWEVRVTDSVDGGARFEVSGVEFD